MRLEEPPQERGCGIRRAATEPQKKDARMRARIVGAHVCEVRVDRLKAWAFDGGSGPDFTQCLAMSVAKKLAIR